jgi:hypothetical protein
VCFWNDTATMPSTMPDVVTMSIHFHNVNNQNLYTMNNVLSQAIQITSTEYCSLIAPKFITQTEMADDFTYFVVFESENKLFKVLMRLI